MNKKIVIIGGGIAGLSAGIYARLNGFDTKIIEMHSITGGQCTAWERKGYRFDYCLHWLVGTRNGPFHDIWLETDVINDQVKIIDHEVHTKIYAEDGTDFTVYTNIDKWEKYLSEIAPEDTKSIKKMCRDMRKTSVIEPYSNPPELRRLRDKIGSLIKILPAIIIFIKYGKKTLREYIGQFNFKSPRLTLFFDNLFPTGDFSALAFIMMLAWFHKKNAGYLLGGSKPMAQRMTEKYLRLSGILLTQKKAEKIIVENNIAKGVLLDDGSKIFADYVISAADGHSTIFEMLDGKYLSEQIKEAYNSWELFNPIVQVSFGVNSEIKTDIPVQSWISKNTNIGQTKSDQGYSIMNYCFDPSMAPPGKTVIVIRFESQWGLWKDLEGEEYRKEKQQIEKDARLLIEKHYPGITKNIEVVDVATPVTDVRYTGVWKGSYEGFLPSSKNLMSNLKPTLPGLDGFYMAGQWLAPGGGLPPAGQTGKWAVQLICKKEKKLFSTR